MNENVLLHPKLDLDPNSIPEWMILTAYINSNVMPLVLQDKEFKPEFLEIKKLLEPDLRVIAYLLKEKGENVKFALKEIKDSCFDIIKFLKVIKIANERGSIIAKYHGISKNPSTQNYIIVMDLFDGGLHNFLTKKFWNLGWHSKIDILALIAWGLEGIHAKNLVHCELHSGNILINDNFGPYNFELRIDLEVDNNIMRQLEIADENQKNISKSQKQELIELFSDSSKLHPQSCYFSRNIYTLHGLHDLLDEIKSGKSSDPNLLKPNESTILRTNS
ncbi:4984_t:CDS:2 [Diversispora eburnea]|uniref:4984_t:CDS:1 n=1 Tax=Diversispora eburnea TaxID=1213867 RepID=A0A9N8ZVY2_9GLOM|nr:4984_t:CDS:2 [Diversispora eburnea]